MGANAMHNVPAVRSYSFARVLPKLALKMARIPAMFGGAMIAGLAYIQYQAAQAGNYVVDVFGRAGEAAREAATEAAGGLYASGKGVMDQIGAGWEKTKAEFGVDVEVPEWLQKLCHGQRC